MRSKDKRKICHWFGVFVAALALVDVLGIEFGFLPAKEADMALNVLIVLLAAALGLAFFFKNRDD